MKIKDLLKINQLREKPILDGPQNLKEEGLNKAHFMEIGVFLLVVVVTFFIVMALNAIGLGVLLTTWVDVIVRRVGVGPPFDIWVAGSIVETLGAYSMVYGILRQTKSVLMLFGLLAAAVAVMCYKVIDLGYIISVPKSNSK